MGVYDVMTMDSYTLNAINQLQYYETGFFLLKVFYGESTPKIDTQSELYSTLFNVNQRTRELNLLRIEMMKYFGWSRVGTIAREGDNWKYVSNLIFRIVHL